MLDSVGYRGKAWEKRFLVCIEMINGVCVFTCFFKAAIVSIENELSKSIHKAYAREFHSLWQEYEDGETAEARFVKDLDKFEMILQAYEYEQGMLAFWNTSKCYGIDL